MVDFYTPRRWAAGLGAWLVGALLPGLLLLTGFAAAEQKKKPEKPINLNTAAVGELMQLPGVGEVLAKRIVSHREKSGKFRRVEELLVIRGITRKKLEQLRPYVTVEEANEANEAQEAKEAKEKN